MINERCDFFIGRDWRWNFFDSIIVWSAIAEIVLKLLASLAFSGPSSALRVLRVLRLVRTIRVVRVLNCFRELRLVLHGIMNSISSLFWLIILLILIIFIFSVYFTEVVTEHRTAQEGEPEDPVVEAMQEHYSSMIRTLYSLFKAISSGESWGNLAKPLIAINPFLGVLFASYVSFAIFAVLNVVTGVFVDNAQKASENDTDHVVMEEIGERRRAMEAVKAVFKAATKDSRDNELRFQDFERLVGDARIQAYFRMLKLDIDTYGPDGLFSLLDFDGDGTVDIDEFVVGCTKLRGSARSLDVAMLQLESKRHSEQVKNLTEAFSTMHESITVIEGSQKTLKDLILRLQQPGGLQDNSVLPLSSTDFDRPMTSL